MQVSKILFILCLIFAMTVLVISPAIAVEHPWEEGEGGEGIPDDGTPGPDGDITPPPEEGEPLLSSIGGSYFIWWQIIWESLSGDDALNTHVVSSGSHTDAEDVKQPRTHITSRSYR